METQAIIETITNLIQEKKLLEALAVAREGHSKYRDNIVILDMAAGLANKLEQYEEALWYLEKAVILSPNAIRFQRIQDINAKVAQKKQQSAKPESSNTASRMQSLIEEIKKLNKNGQYETAWQLICANGEHITPSNVSICFWGILILNKLGQNEKALERAQKWLDNNIPNADILKENVEILYFYNKLLRLQLTKPENRAGGNEPPEQAHPPEPPNPPLHQESPLIELLSKWSNKLFVDKTDLLSFFCWLGYTGIFFYYAFPYLNEIGNHPTWEMLKSMTGIAPYLGKIPASILWMVLVAVIMIPVSMAVKRETNSHTNPNEQIIFDETRRFWSYRRWLPCFLVTQISLSKSIWLFNFADYNRLVALVGLVAVALWIYCFWILIPEARTRIQLIRAKDSRQNRLIISSGVFLSSEEPYFPSDIHKALIRESALWLLFGAENVDVNLPSGHILRLIAPSSYKKTKQLSSMINAIVNECKITQNPPNPHDNWNIDSHTIYNI